MSSKAYVALGSNLGNRVQAIYQAIQHINTFIGKVTQTSLLYETPPMHYLNQPVFLNAVCEVSLDNTSLKHKTQSNNGNTLSPTDLLAGLKAIEKKIGRVETIRNGPRVIDLDILFYGDQVISDGDQLEIPHPRMHQRAFVLKPLVDIIPSFQHPILKQSMSQLMKNLPMNDISNLKRVLPLKNSHIINSTQKDRILSFEKIRIAGIINTTPDSFSDGGKFYSVENALFQAERLIADGADMIDIGGESTRPGSKIISTEEELDRVIPVIRAIRSKGFPCILSIDTRNSIVAYEAIREGVDIINDVSGGRHDSNMLSVASTLQVPMILMHMRGTPQTMTSIENITYGDDMIKDVIQELHRVCDHATSAGIPRWAQIIDPGIGFAKDSLGNMKLLDRNSIDRMKIELGNRVMMIGMSKKRFLLDILQKSFPRQDQGQGQNQGQDQGQAITMEDRDWATAGICCKLLDANVEILRVHNVRGIHAALSAYQSLSHPSSTNQ